MTRTSICRGALTGAALCVGLCVVAGQTGPALVIIDPAADSYLVGPVVLKAAIEPPAAIARMDFFADGELICQVQRAPFECDWNAGADVRAHAVRVVAVLADGSRLINSVRTLELKGVSETVNVDVVLVPFVVTDWLGRFVKGLTRESVLVFEDEKLRTITFFQSEDIPLDVVVAIDVSGSVDPILPRLKAAVKRFLAGFKASDRVTLMAFNDRVYVLARQETDAAHLARAVDPVVAAGGTSLYDALLTSLELLGPEVRRRAIVVFTDGYDQTSLAELEFVEESIRASDAIFYFITEGAAAETQEVQRVVEHLAGQSGGRSFAIGEAKHLDRTLEAIREDLENQYLLGYALDQDAGDGAYRRIAVKTVKGRYDIRARDGYTPRAKD